MLAPASTVFVSSSPEETQDIGMRIGQSLQKGAIVFLTGNLGAGKTTLMKGLVHAVTGHSLQSITSPTFSYVHHYPGLISLYHFDLYRLDSENAFLEAGFYEFLREDSIACIEWPERLPSDLVLHPVRIHITYLSADQRNIHVELTHVH